MGHGRQQDKSFVDPKNRHISVVGVALALGPLDGLVGVVYANVIFGLRDVFNRRSTGLSQIH